MNMRPSEENTDPREALAYKLVEFGFDLQEAFVIAIDCGSNVVDRKYLIDMGLKGKKLISSENCIKSFYWLGV